MKISFLLHFYQPYNQQLDILNRVVNESYRPIISGLLANDTRKININITGALIELLLKYNYVDVLDGIKTLLQRNQIELLGSSMYHALLPLLPEDEVLRQIEQNSAISSDIFGASYHPSGFFSPEMAVSPMLLTLLKKFGFRWVAAPELALENQSSNSSNLFIDNVSGLHLFLRNKRISSLILSSIIRDSGTLIKETTDINLSDKYWFCVMDAETFGHHRIGHEKTLFDILDNTFFEPTLASDLLKLPIDTLAGDLRACTWTNQEQDFWLKASDKSFILWQDPENPIHKLQWELTNFTINSLKNAPDKTSKSYLDARQLLDKALGSDQFWWASGKPWWSLEMIEQGAFTLVDVIRVLNTNSQDILKAEDYYHRILAVAFDWQRSGYIRKKHLENSATFMKEPFKKRAPSEWFNQLVLEFEDAMHKAAETMDFERAIKWRDALLKIKQGTDIYDILHVVDELWSARHLPELKPFLTHEWEEFSKYAKENFKDVSNKDDFEQWKKSKDLDNNL